MNSALPVLDLELWWKAWRIMIHLVLVCFPTRHRLIFIPFWFQHEFYDEFVKKFYVCWIFGYLYCKSHQWLWTDSLSSCIEIAQHHWNILAPLQANHIGLQRLYMDAFIKFAARSSDHRTKNNMQWRTNRSNKEHKEFDLEAASKPSVKLPCHLFSSSCFLIAMNWFLAFASTEEDT